MRQQVASATVRRTPGCSGRRASFDCRPASPVPGLAILREWHGRPLQLSLFHPRSIYMRNLSGIRNDVAVRIDGGHRRESVRPFVRPSIGRPKPTRPVAGDGSAERRADGMKGEI